MPTIDQRFSRNLKVQKLNYINNDPIDFDLIERQLLELSVFPVLELTTDEQKKCFWINVYNGLTNYWIITKSIKKKMKENRLIFIHYKIDIGGFLLSLDNIEHGILRCNAKVKYRPIPQFLFWDKRRHLVCEKLDYRIHFALNCGANSCPAIAFYDLKGIEEQLDRAEQSFAETEFFVDEASKTIKCSKIYAWYRKDFVNVYLNDSRYLDYKVELLAYDWRIN